MVGASSVGGSNSYPHQWWDVTLCRYSFTVTPTVVVRTGFEPVLGLTTYDILFTTTPCRHLTILQTYNISCNKAILYTVLSLADFADCAAVLSRSVLALSFSIWKLTAFKNSTSGIFKKKSHLVRSPPAMLSTVFNQLIAGRSFLLTSSSTSPLPALNMLG